MNKNHYTVGYHFCQLPRRGPRVACADLPPGRVVRLHAVAQAKGFAKEIATIVHLGPGFHAQPFDRGLPLARVGRRK